MFLRRFPAIIENHISVDWNTISGVYDRTPTLPITLIDTEILDDWFGHPQVWDVLRDLQHVRHVLALVLYTLPTPYKGQPAIVFGASFVFVPAYQACTNLRDGLTFLKSAKEDSVVLVAMPSKPTYSPQPQRGRYLTLLPISGSPDVDQGPLHTFAAAGLPVARKEGHGGDMSVRVKMAVLLWVLQASQERIDVGARTPMRSIVEECPLCRAQPQWRVGEGSFWEAPVPGTVDPHNRPFGKTGVHTHRSRASNAFDTGRLPC